MARRRNDAKDVYDDEEEEEDLTSAETAALLKRRFEERLGRLMNLSPRERQRYDLRTLVRSYYDIQKLRISMGNRIAMNFLVKSGVMPGTKKKEVKEVADTKVLEKVERDYIRIVDGLVRYTPSRVIPRLTGVITQFAEFSMIKGWVELKRCEERQKGDLSAALDRFPIWTNYLRHIPGCGPAMAGVIIGEIDIHRAKYVSSLWTFAGLNVRQVGDQWHGQGRYKRHMDDVQYLDKRGRMKVRKGHRYNPFLKTKLMGVLADCLIRQVDYQPVTAREFNRLPEDRRKLRKFKNPETGETDELPFARNNGFYASIYLAYRYRLDTHPIVGAANDGKEVPDNRFTCGKNVVSKGWRNQRAKRYMVKIFLQHLYEAWKDMEGLERFDPYVTAKQGVVTTHHPRPPIPEAEPAPAPEYEPGNADAQAVNNGQADLGDDTLIEGIPDEVTGGQAFLPTDLALDKPSDGRSAVAVTQAKKAKKAKKVAR